MAEELARRIKEGAIPIISDVEGFKAYYVVYAGDDTVTAISLFNNFAGAEEANKRALAWIDENLGPLLAGPASAVAGPVIVHTLAWFRCCLSFARWGRRWREAGDEGFYPRALLAAFGRRDPPHPPRFARRPLPQGGEVQRMRG